MSVSSIPRYVVERADRAGTTHEIAYCKTVRDALWLRDRLLSSGNRRYETFYVFDAENPERGAIHEEE